MQDVISTEQVAFTVCPGVMCLLRVCYWQIPSYIWQDGVSLRINVSTGLSDRICVHPGMSCDHQVRSCKRPHPGGHAGWKACGKEEMVVERSRRDFHDVVPKGFECNVVGQCRSIRVPDVCTGPMDAFPDSECFQRF